MKDRVYIYTLSDPRSNKVRYVGKTAQALWKRMDNHLHSKQKNHTRSWVKSLQALRLKPVMEIIDIVPEENWQFWEKYWISQFKTWGFDLTNHSEGGEGVTWTIELRKKLSALQTGRKRSAEAIRITSEKCKGRKRTLDQRQRMSEGWKRRFSITPFKPSEKQLINLKKATEKRWQILTN